MARRGSVFELSSGTRPAGWGDLRRLRALVVVLAASFAAAMVGPPGVASAAVWSTDTMAAYGLNAEYERLREIREQIADGEAKREGLRRRLRELSREIGAARRRAEQAGMAIVDLREAARAQEGALDRIVPRLAARTRSIEQRRGQAARALADLASLSRRSELDPELRARMHAIGPALIALLRKRDGASVALAAEFDRVVALQQSLAVRIPRLHAEIEQLAGRRLEMQGERHSTQQELAQAAAELHRLSSTSALLARRLAVVEAAHVARAEPGADRPAQDRRATVISGAVTRGQAARSIGRLLVAQPGLSSPAMAQATMAAVVSPQATRLTVRLAPARAVRQAWLPEARPLAIRHDRAIDALKGHATPRQMARGPVAPLARPLSSVMSVAGLSSRVDAARLPPPAPIRPSPELVAARADRPGHDQDIAIAAAPGQPVAAPQDGRIVFADPFKSYGLLLIIEHNSEYHTLLWGFAKLRVEVGDEVRGGEIIGIMDVVDGVPPRLGVELRRRGRPVNPLPWLAGSSSKVRG